MRRALCSETVGAVALIDSALQRGVTPVDPTDAILVVGPSWVGDMVMAQSFFMELKKRYPDSAIDVLAPGWVLPLLDRMPEVRRGIESPFRHGELALARRFRLGRSLRGQYGRAFVLPNSLKSALIPYWARISKRMGYRGEFRYGLLNEPRKLDPLILPRTVERFVALATDSGATPTDFELPKLSVNSSAQRATLDKFGLAAIGQPILALCPGAEYGPAKCWPVEHFAEVAGKKHKDGWRVWVFGSAADRLVADQINQLAAGVCENLAGRTTLAQACDLLAMADAVVTNDSGLMHVAAALGRRVYCMYGSSDPGFTPPLSEQATIFSLGLSCSPCFKRECPLGHLKCLQDLQPAQVLAAMD